MFWTRGAKVSQESFAPPKPCFAPVQLSFAPVQGDLGALGPKDLLHPLLTTWGTFEVSGPSQQVLNLTPLNPTPATCHKRKRKLRCSFRSAALQKLHCNIGFSAVRKLFGPKAALQQAKNYTATSKKLRCRKVALSCRFPAGFKPPRLGTHV